MNVAAIRADSAYVLRSWARSRSGVAVSLGMPLILLLALGFLVQPAAPAAATVDVVDLAGTPEARRVVDALLASEAFAAREAATPSGEARGEVALPPGFAGAPGDVRVAADGAELGDALAATIEAALARDPAAAGILVDPLPVAEPTSYATFLLPGVLGLTVLMTGLPTGFTSVVELRHAGLLERLAVSPMTKREWLLARMLGASVVALAAAVVLVVVAWLALGVAPRITPWSLLLVVAGTLIFSGLGVLLGAAVRDPATGGAVMNLALLPLVLLSGSFFDVASLPAPLRWAALASPLTHLNRGLRADMLGIDASVAAVHALGLTGAALLLLALGGRLVRWQARD